MPENVDITGQGGQKCRRIDRELAVLAARQHGVVSRGQLLALGYGPDAVRYRARQGRLHRVHTGVYAVGHGRLSARGRYMTAALTCGDGALVSIHSAAVLHGFLDSARALIDVTVGGPGPRARKGIAIHRRQSPHPDDRVTVDGIPVTSAARTLRDLAAVVPARRLERAFEEAERLRVLDLGALEAVAARRRGKRGATAFALLLGTAIEPDLTRSELERRFLELCRAAGLPRPSINAVVEGTEVDFHWAESGLVVEVDGFENHRTRAAFERDRERDMRLQLAGYRVVRLTALSLRRPEAPARLGRLLARQPV
ncbi:MAG: type IV toxin-antitoxin system AbiEi family antitoxin domain-containing protein [Thermoleophilaceae bacterium]|nr:type IV toxin-antitoxin system AbiEi family antitoxin domain-containing protein [Thermoleophilaceae bacterium]